MYSSGMERNGIPNVELVEMQNSVNDDDFALAAAKKLIELMK